MIESVELFFFVSFFKISLLNLYSFIQISKYLLHIHLLCIQRVRINCLNVTATVVIAFFCELLKSFAISWQENDNSRTRVGESYTKNKETEKKNIISPFEIPCSKMNPGNFLNESLLFVLLKTSCMTNACILCASYCTCIVSVSRFLKVCFDVPHLFISLP